ncbi:hypothetical protein [Polaribacter sp. Hel_I_88]|uniref:hypothetical protein n=1 Tax=Polaribacter sp. Hel_I_88 TaxID=1250006 RepID=UPI00047B8B9B|nr:hypothetical protein [Polaribacter sp. Hel_I_88]|tara:strand:- start:1839 stop:2183 length:345 start_codon:yes stop_codon:yes gene_type:complete
MSETNSLLEILCGDFGTKSLSFYDLLMFFLGSFVLISILLLYYNKIPKSNTPKSEIDAPIYQSKDILLQSNNLDSNFIVAEKTTSNFTKIIVFVMIAIVVFTPLYQLFGVEHFV